MRRFLLTGLVEGERRPLDPGASAHLVRVLRLGPGERVVLFDGTGSVAEATIDAVESGVAWVRIGPVHHDRGATELHLVLAVTRSASMDLAVRMATEAGATHLHPFVAERSMARADKRERWDRIAAAAAQQCGRADVPTIAEPGRIDAVIRALPPGLDLRVAHRDGPVMPRARGPAAVMVGPEGGLSPAEIALANHAGFVSYSLGPFTLRACTAAAVAVAATHPGT